MTKLARTFRTASLFFLLRLEPTAAFTRKKGAKQILVFLRNLATLTLRMRQNHPVEYGLKVKDTVLPFFRTHNLIGLAKPMDQSGNYGGAGKRSKLQPRIPLSRAESPQRAAALTHLYSNDTHLLRFASSVNN
jgi:hypothetical protein